MSQKYKNKIENNYFAKIFPKYLVFVKSFFKNLEFLTKLRIKIKKYAVK